MSIKIDAYELCGDQHEEEYNQAFNQGAEAAWELARKIVAFKCDGGYGLKEIKELFGYDCIQDIMKNLTYSEAATKVAEWEKKEKDEIKVGDIVINSVNDKNLCVMCISPDKKYYSGADEYGTLYYMLSEETINKTGRHIDVDSFLKQIGGKEK